MTHTVAKAARARAPLLRVPATSRRFSSDHVGQGERVESIPAALCRVQCDICDMSRATPGRVPACRRRARVVVAEKRGELAVCRTHYHGGVR